MVVTESMVFSSTTFLFIFFPAVLALYFIPHILVTLFSGKKKFGESAQISNSGLTIYKNLILLIASLAFYAYGEPTLVLLMVGSILVCYVFGRLLGSVDSPGRKKLILILAIGIHLGIFFIFKYLTFIMKEIYRFGLFGLEGNSPVNIMLPIGISFYTFQIMSYLFDVYYGKVKAEKSLFALALYVSFFPQLIAGPIVRFTDISREIRERRESLDGVAEGLSCFIIGLAKKVLLANFFAVIADYAFGPNTVLSVGSAWIGTIAYDFQLYFDFSGYSDMAIGLGRIFGFKFPKNFDHPFISHSCTEFWRRWHMTLGSWFKDYVYIPLGGNRHGKARTMFNILMVWLLPGIWHGANWIYLVWGMLLFVFVYAEKLTGYAKRAATHTGLRRIPGTIMAFLSFVLAVTVFRSDSIGSAIRYLGKMVGYKTTGVWDSRASFILWNAKWLFLVGIIAATPLATKLLERIKTKFGESVASMVKMTWCAFIFVLSLIAVISSAYNPFIYFNF